MEAAPRCGGAARQGLLGPSRHSPALVGTPRRLRAGERQEAAPRVESRGGPLTGAELGPPGARNGLWLPCQSAAGRRPLWGCPGAPANSRGRRQGASWQPVRRGSPRGCLSFPHAGLRAGDAGDSGGRGVRTGQGPVRGLGGREGSVAATGSRDPPETADLAGLLGPEVVPGSIHSGAR